MTKRWRIDLAYDGTGFHGWATQPGLRTVQGELETWITRISRSPEPVALTVAGRTDAGVHARGQVAHVDLPDDHDGDHLACALIKALPPDIVISGFAPAAAGFDARFSALWRRYAYRLWDDLSRPDPLLRHLVTKVSGELDLDAMNQGAATLLGLRDFAPFAKYREGATTIRDLKTFHLKRLDDECGTIMVTVSADAFCHSMVRSLVGAITAVGSGRRDLDWLARTAVMSTRCGEIHVMPAKGLCLEEVGYPGDDGLAERAAASRVRRLRSELEQR
mgnify:CR=1 FL=1